MADELHVHAHALEQIAQEEHLRADAGELGRQAQVGRHIDFVGHGRQIIGGRAGVLHIGDDGLAARGAEMRQRFAQLAEGGHAGAVAVGAQVDELHRGIRGGGVDGLHGIPDAEDVGRLHAAAHDQGRRIHVAEGAALLRLLTDHQVAQVDLEHAGLGQGGLAAARRSHRAYHPEGQDEADDSHDEEAANDGQDHFDKIFHDKKSKISQK